MNLITSLNPLQGLKGWFHSKQQPSQPYERVPSVLHKYFIAHLSAIMQRFTLERILDEAASAVRQKGSTTEQQELQALHDNTLDFTVTGYFTEISSREIINQFYRLAQTGLRVPETFQIVQHGLHYIDTKNETKFQHNVAEKLNDNVNEVTSVQRKMEWFEIFFVSFYAAYHISSPRIFNFLMITGLGASLFGPCLAELSPSSPCVPING